MVAGSIYIVHIVLVIVAIALCGVVDDCLKDLQARILVKPLASTPHGPLNSLFLMQPALPSHHLSLSIPIQECCQPSEEK